MVIIGAGAVLRLFRLGHSLRVDELEMWAYARLPLWDIATGLDRLPHSPLLYRLSDSMLGSGEFFLRIPFALYGILTLPLVFLTGRELFDDEVGILATLLLAVSVFHIGYCQEARYYAPLAFYSLSAFFCLMRILRREDESRRRTYLAGFILSHLLNLYLHRMAVYPFALCAVMIVWDICQRSLRRKAPASARDWAPALLMALILIGIIISQWQWLRDAVFRESSGALTLRMSYLTWHYRDPRGSVVWELLSAYSGGGQAGVVLLAAGAVGFVARGKDGWRRSAPLLLWIGLPLISMAVVRSRTHFEFRYFIFVLPAWLLWAAAGLSATATYVGTRLGEGVRRWALMGTVVTILTCEIPSLAAHYRLPKARIREVFDFVNASCASGDAVVMYPSWDPLWYGYYRLKDGCRLSHPANLIEDSPAFAPEGIVGASRRVWLAGTWIADPVRAKEFERVRGLLSRRCALEGESIFQSRDPNDNYRVDSFRCRGGRVPDRGAPALSAKKDLRPSFWRWRGYRLLANIPEAVGRIQGRWSLSQDLSLVSGKTGFIDAGSRGKILFVWSGQGMFGGAAGAENFSAGDVFFLPRGTVRRWRGSTSSDSAILEIVLPGDLNGARVASRRLGNALSAGFAQGETVLLRGEGWRLVLFRLAPGARRSAARDSRPPMSRMLSVLVRGRLRIRRNGEYYHAFEGDLFTAAKFGIPSPWILENPGLLESIELRLVRESGSVIPSPMTSSTGKGVGAWPPMLIP